MSQALLFVGLYLVGVAVSLGIGPRRPLIAIAVAFPLGLAIAALTSLAVLAVGLPYLESLAAALIVYSVAGLALARKRERLDRKFLKPVALWTIGFAAVACAASSVNLSILSYDSHALIIFGQVIGQDRAFGPGLLGQLSHWGVFVPLVQSWALFLPVEYLWALAPVLGLSFVPLFALLLADLIESQGAPALARRTSVLVTAALCTVFFFHHHFIYIHNNVPSAIYLFGFVGLAIHAETRRDHGALLIAYLLLTACAIQRIEAPLLTLLFAVIVAFTSKLQRRFVALAFGFYLAAICGWYILLAANAPAEGELLTPNRCYLVVAMMTGTYLLWWLSARAPLARLAPHTSSIVLGLIGVGLMAAFILKPAHMGISARSMGLNLIVSDYWGLAWPLIALLLLLAFRLPRVAPLRVVSVGVAASVGLILLLSFGRFPYRAIHVGDSANRMMLHLLPLIFYYVGGKLGAAK